MIKNLISKLFGEPERHQGQQDTQLASPAIKEAALPDISRYADPEIQVIANRFGELVEGMVITTTLSELEETLPRPRRRADAYATVAKRLAAMGVTLVIKREVRHGQ